jgi:hypothetical protein
MKYRMRQHEVFPKDVFHQLPVSEAQTSTVLDRRRFDVPGVDCELNELWREALVHQKSADHAFVS